jgi:hypothetical protein
MKAVRCVLATALCLGLALEARAQEENREKKTTDPKEFQEALDALRTEYEERISNLELTLELMESEKSGEAPADIHQDDHARVEASAYHPSQGVSPGLLGQLGQTDRFSNTFNPAVGLVIDTIAHASTSRESREGQDRLWLRAAELSLAAHVDPFGYGYAIFEGSEGDSAEVIEAAAVMNRLPANFTVKAGRLLADVTKFGQRHDHELPFVEKPGALREFLGGSLQGTGIELHQWFGLSDEIPLRWSLGMYSELEGHSHAIGFEHVHEHDHGADYKRKLDNFSYTGRVTTYMDLDEENSLQFGASAWWAPDVPVHEETAPAGVRFHTRRALGGVDVTYKWQDPASQRTFFLGGEALLSDGKFLQEVGAHHRIIDERAHGGYLWSEYAWDPHWSVGCMADAFSHIEDAGTGQRDYSAFLTWRISHFNQLRLQYRFNDLERTAESRGEDHHEIMLQWSIVIGSHGHALDW